MANRIKIRRGSGTPTGSSLLPYEIGWSTSQRALYINNGTTDAPVIRQLNSETIKGIPLASGDNVDQLANVGVYQSDSQAMSAALTGTVPTTTSGFRLEVKAGYGGGTGYGTTNNYGITQIAYCSDSDIKFRKKASNSSGDFTNVPWQTIVTSTNVSSYALPITGGTLTGNVYVNKTTNPWITIKSDSMDNIATSITADTYATLYFSDQNDKTCSYIQCIQSTSGQISTVVAARHRDSDGNNLTNYLYLRQNATSESASVTVSHPAAWRSAIGAVNIAGGTMTGNLYVEKNNPSIIAKDPNGITAQLIVGSAHQNHGIYSTGYSTDGTAAGFVSNTKWLVYRDGSGDVYLNGNAASATYTSNIRVTSTTPTANTSYFLLFTTGQISGTNYVVRTNETVRVWIGANLSSVYLTLGDSSHYGAISLFSSAGKYLNLKTSSMSDSNKTITFPNENGTVALAEKVLALSGGNMTGTIVTTSDYGFNYKYSFAKGASGSGYKSTWCIRWTDNTGTLDNAHSYGDIYNQRSYADSQVKTAIRAFKHAAGNADNVYLWVTYYDNDTKAINTNGKVYGAVWNDYAEYRDTLENSKPGQCVIENGDDSLRLSTSRMQRAAHIVSDTFGFAIGKTDKCKTPVAVSGRVLAYIYEGREVAREAIGRPVCSGPNGTVSIMTDEEYKNFGYCAIGTISAVPEYEKWGEKDEEVNVDGRIWIKVY